MAEIIFIFIILYVTYLLHSDYSKKQSKKEDPIALKPQVNIPEIANKTDKRPVVKITTKKMPLAKKPKAVTKVTIKTKVAKAKIPTGSIRHPETGEMVKLATSYRMTRRWIKEALVTEALLERIYKTNEIDEKVEMKITEALAKLLTMDKYQ